MDMFFAYTARLTFIIYMKFFPSFTQKKQFSQMPSLQGGKKKKADKELIKEKKNCLKNYFHN